MAHKKSGGSSRNGRDSESKRLGVKKYGGENVLAGQVRIEVVTRAHLTETSARIDETLKAQMQRMAY